VIAKVGAALSLCFTMAACGPIGPPQPSATRTTPRVQTSVPPTTTAGIPPVALAGIPDTWNGVHLGVISGGFDASANPLVAAEVGYVLWGGPPHGYLPEVADHAKYCKLAGETSGDPKVAAQIRAQHPDWITYKSDRTAPAYYSVGSFTDTTHLPLDLTNPQVQDFIVQECAGAAISSGYDGVAFDHGSTLNQFGVAGHRGTNGQWVQLYSGALIDPAYRQVKIAAFSAIVAKVRAYGAARGHPLHIGINENPDLAHPQDWFDLVPFVDMVFIEMGFTRYGKTGSPWLTSEPDGTDQDPWLTTAQGIIALQRTYGKAVLINALEDYPIDESRPPQPADLEWVLGNYLLVKQHACFTAVLSTNNNATHMIAVNVAAYLAPIGTPTGDIASSGGAWVRPYSSGYVAVNPSPTNNAAITLPAGNWVQLDGSPMTSSLTLARHSATVLLRH
jgi:hypothetical protein